MNASQAFHKLLFAQGSELDPVLASVRAFIVFVIAIIYVRVARKRFIAQSSAIDIVVAVMLGSMLSRAINGGATLLSSLASCLVIVALERLAAKYAFFSHRFGILVKGDSETIIKEGIVDHEAMKYHDLTMEDLKSDLRIYSHVNDPTKVKLAVLERSGRVSAVIDSELVGSD